MEYRLLRLERRSKTQHAINLTMFFLVGCGAIFIVKQHFVIAKLKTNSTEHKVVEPEEVSVKDLVTKMIEADRDRLTKLVQTVKEFLENKATVSESPFLDEAKIKIIILNTLKDSDLQVKSIVADSLTIQDPKGTPRIRMYYEPPSASPRKWAYIKFVMLSEIGKVRYTLYNADYPVSAMARGQGPSGIGTVNKFDIYKPEQNWKW